jgi:hypothetical protein
MHGGETLADKTLAGFVVTCTVGVLSSPEGEEVSSPQD